MNADRPDVDWAQQLLALIQDRYRQLNALPKADRAQYRALEAEIAGLSEQYTALSDQPPVRSRRLAAAAS